MRASAVDQADQILNGSMSCPTSIELHASAEVTNAFTEPLAYLFLREPAAALAERVRAGWRSAGVGTFAAPWPSMFPVSW